MNNKGIELAISQIVLLLISITILILGIAFMYKVFGAAEEQLPSLDAQLEQQLQNALSTGSVVEMPLNVKKIGKKELAVFGLGIRNDPKLVEGVANPTGFGVIISYSKAVNKQGALISTCTTLSTCGTGMIKDSLLIVPNIPYDSPNKAYSKTFTIQPNAIQTLTLGVAPAQNTNFGGLGQYFYNVCVCYNGACKDKTTNAPQFKCDATTYSNTKYPYGFTTFSVIVE